MRTCSPGDEAWTQIQGISPGFPGNGADYDRSLYPKLSVHRPVHALATAADVMRPAPATVEPRAHVAAAAYLMKHAGLTAVPPKRCQMRTVTPLSVQ